MNDILYIMPTEFFDFTTKTRTYGVRVFNNVSHAYDNRWIEMPMNGLDILRKLVDSADYQIMELLDKVMDDKAPVIIGSKLYKYIEIESILINDIVSPLELTQTHKSTTDDPVV